MEVLHDAGDFIVYRDADRVVFVDRGIRLAVWARLVLALLTMISGVNTVVQLALVLTGQGSIGVALTVVGFSVAFGFALVAIHRHAQRAQGRPLSELPPLLILDLEEGVLQDRGGQALADLDDVYFRAVVQAASSGKALECRWPGGHKIVHRGGGMGLTGVSGALDAMRSLGLRTR